MDFKLLADALTTFLAPAMPYLVGGGEDLVEEAGKKLGEHGLGLVKTLWAKLRPKVEEKPAATEAAQEVARVPEDADAQAALRVQLRKILEADTSLAAEVAKLLEAAGPKLQGSGVIVQGNHNVTAGGGGIVAGRDVKISK
jgi:hypothetical protein